MDEEDPVARNRSTSPRRTPGREPVGWATTRRWIRLTGAVVGLATAVLVTVLVIAAG